MAESNAAENLVGLTLETGWKVIEKIVKPRGATGGFFSVCYKVEKNNEICFLKAYNFEVFFRMHSSVIDALHEMTEAYKYERNLSLLCQDNHITKVVYVKDSGEARVPGYSITVVPYLIFDLADQDIRTKISFSSNLEDAWKLKSLHSVAVGLKQLHKIEVSHQDLKPSNVLLFKNESKIGDLGRSTCLNIESPLKLLPFAGDRNYAPPEILYGYIIPDWKIRSYATDLYMLGNLIVYYFSGLLLTALIRGNLPDELSWEKYNGFYNDVLEYVVQAFHRSLDELESHMGSSGINKQLIELVTYLCHPDLLKRGHPSNAHESVRQFNLERTVSQLDLLYRKSKYFSSDSNNG